MSIWFAIDGGDRRQAEYQVTGGPRVAWMDQERDVWRALGEMLSLCAAAAAVGELELPVRLEARRWDSDRTSFEVLAQVELC